MTRSPFIPALVFIALAVGCASRPAVRQGVAPARIVPGPAATALAFTPPVARDVDGLDLDRADRRTVAYAGYEQNVLSVTYTTVDDDQRYYGRGRNGGDDSQYQRRSISTTVTVRGQ